MLVRTAPSKRISRPIHRDSWKLSTGPQQQQVQFLPSELLVPKAPAGASNMGLLVSLACWWQALTGGKASSTKRLTTPLQPQRNSTLSKPRESTGAGSAAGGCRERGAKAEETPPITDASCVSLSGWRPLCLKRLCFCRKVFGRRVLLLAAGLRLTQDAASGERSVYEVRIYCGQVLPNARAAVAPPAVSCSGAARTKLDATIRAAGYLSMSEQFTCQKHSCSLRS